jgi:hypothetical protein
MNPGFNDSWTISGRFRNASVAPMESVRVRISFEDKSGKLVRSQMWFCLPSTIEAGEDGSFDTIAEGDARIDHVKLDFMNLDKSIPWIDRSGKNAHR